MFDLTGKTALVTGATGGIGEAIASALHAQGATVAITGRREAELARVAEALGGARVIVAPADLSDPAAPAALVEKIEGEAGGLDILVNNAGFTRDMLALRMGDADWNAVLEVDLTAPFRLARAALRGMMKKRYGRIVSIASIVGVTGNAGQANYAAAKAGLIGMSKSLAQEVATRGVTVNVVAPGFVKTAMTDALNDAQKTALLSRIPTQRMGTPEDIASAVVYLSSTEAGWVTGQTLHVNGGMAMI
ncbi:3-oxoacyl-[acyl-carrier-protein] reductase [Neoroseomonas oryzicola]|uniref:3-oxoacyl-[acyl-carrier-protein] reductase n=1 Tax=Neoroseomonas oryzicola TaxID=535904 RepID=A0A9X9WII2_9PROT|nr:3-oxoacyl-[acyl-carrier-protein] reductase [Neoroseomonas oryzicola]MBR0660142.1 3-oxoacyl-[acyl-carrier-protein] reductase [Neoroseomonas oryzicola]NKE19393.1 3-oxoacyl-[acyl-carrier-protein] reductase [Neoroseomonas oryzicola]